MFYLAFIKNYSLLHYYTLLSMQLLAKDKLASGSKNNSIKVWNVDCGECIRTFTGHSRSVESLQLLANKQFELIK